MLWGQAYTIAIMLWAKDTTESDAVVGLIVFAGGVSGLVMPLGGALADRILELVSWCCSTL